MFDKPNAHRPQITFAAAVSPWHALGVDVWLKSLPKRSAGYAGTVLLRRHPFSGMLLSSEDFHVAPGMGIKCKERTKPITYSYRAFRISAVLITVSILPLRNLFGTSRPVLIASPVTVPWSSVVEEIGVVRLLRDGARIFLLDEGFSTYVSSSMWHKRTERESGEAASGNSSTHLRAIVRKLWRAWSDKVLKAMLAEDRALFQVNRDKVLLTPRDNICSQYRAALRGDETAVCSEDELQRSSAKPIALLLTQPWSEGGELVAEKESALLQRVIGYLSNIGFAVRLKVHPREKVGKYDWLLSESCVGCDDLTVFGAGVMAECLFEHLSSDDIVVGFFSTSLINAKVFYSKKVAVVPISWMLDVGSPAELLEYQELFLKLTRRFLLRLDEVG